MSSKTLTIILRLLSVPQIDIIVLLPLPLLVLLCPSCVAEGILRLLRGLFYFSCTWKAKCSFARCPSSWLLWVSGGTQFSCQHLVKVVERVVSGAVRIAPVFFPILLKAMGEHVSFRSWLLWWHQVFL